MSSPEATGHSERHSISYFLFFAMNATLPPVSVRIWESPPLFIESFELKPAKYF